MIFFISYLLKIYYFISVMLFVLFILFILLSYFSVFVNCICVKLFFFFFQIFENFFVNLLKKNFSFNTFTYFLISFFFYFKFLFSFEMLFLFLRFFLFWYLCFSYFEIHCAMTIYPLIYTFHKGATVQVCDIRPSLCLLFVYYCTYPQQVKW